MAWNEAVWSPGVVVSRVAAEGHDPIPDAVSVHVKATCTMAPGAYGPAGGSNVARTSGGTRSIRMPEIGPAIRQLPAALQIKRIPVDALASAAPSGTLVESVNTASAGSTRPVPRSIAVHRIATFPACQA